MIKIADPSRCCGCSACIAVCPHDAIMMQPDGLGFPYPQVDVAGCVDCGLCDSVCSYVQDVETLSELPKDTKVEVLAARNTDGEVLAQSQSGGAFSAMAGQILNDGGVVYGAAFDDSHMVLHVRVSGLAGLAALRGSKYVQSDMTDVFRQVRSDLRNGMRVLFCGTPCQVAGLRSYIPENMQEELYLVDFVCHGVPAPAVWKDYLKYMSRSGTIVKANFRDKDVAGWKEHKETFVYNDGRKKVSDSFRVLFYKNIMLRHSCAVCPYNILNHRSDVTISDFWGLEEVLPQMDGDEGTSMLVCNTEKGRELLRKSSALLVTEKAILDYEFMSRRNPNLVRPARIDRDRMTFEEEFARGGFIRVARRWGDLGIRYRLWQVKKYIFSLFK